MSSCKLLFHPFLHHSIQIKQCSWRLIPSWIISFQCFCRFYECAIIKQMWLELRLKLNCWYAFVESAHTTFLWEKADEPSHCSDSQCHRSLVAYKGSLEPTAAATVRLKLADTMGKVRLAVLLGLFCASSYLHGLFRPICLNWAIFCGIARTFSFLYI